VAAESFAWAGKGVPVGALVLMTILVEVALGVTLRFWVFPRRAHSRVLKLLSDNGAVEAPPGALPATQRALVDIAIATGADPAPGLWLVDSEATDALVVATRTESFVAVTSGLAASLAEDEQRAVFAYLLSPYASSGRCADGAAPENDLAALAVLREPRPLISALLKTAGQAQRDIDAVRTLLGSTRLAGPERSGGAEAGEIDALIARMALPRSGALCWRLPDSGSGVAWRTWASAPSVSLDRARRIAAVSAVEGTAALWEEEAALQASC
jgi:Zn-dependent protease with chaperone function